MPPVRFAISRMGHRALVMSLALGAAVLSPAGPARAQALAAVVNGDPITSTEVDEQMKFRRLTRQGGGRAEALDDLIGDRIKLRAANREGADATDAAFTQALSQAAARAKISSSALLQEFQKGKLNIDLIRSHLRAVAAWNEFVRARFKALSVSDQEVTTAMTKDASLAKAATNYTLQQIVFVVPGKASPGLYEQRMRDAQALRNRFQDCSSGVPLARALPDVAVKPPIDRLESSLTEGARTALAQVQKGRLTAPERTGAGIEMYAVCNRDDDPDRSTVRETVQANLLVDRLAKESDRMYKELRARAVVEKK